MYNACLFIFFYYFCTAKLGQSHTTMARIIQGNR